MDILSWLWARIQEPTTWGGVAAIAAAVHIDPSIVNSTEAIVMAIGGAGAVILPEGRKLIAAVKAMQAKK